MLTLLSLSKRAHLFHLVTFGHLTGITRRSYWRPLARIVGMLLLLAVAAGIPTPAAYAKAGDWPTYLQSNARRGFNAAETIINPSSAPHLKVHWKFLAGGAIFSQPIEANGHIYWGSFDGYEHESNLDGSQVWQQFLGQKPSNCGKNVFGVVSTATVASVSINGTL